MQQYILKINKYVLFSVDKSYIDAKCSPHHFPQDIYDFNKIKHQRKVSRCIFIRSQLRNKDRRFAQDPNYIDMCSGLLN